MSAVSRAPGTFDANEHDRREMSPVFDENAAHRDDTPACFGISEQIPAKPQRPPEAFVLNQPARS